MSKLEVVFSVNRRMAKKDAAKLGNGLYAYPLGKQYYGLVKCYKGTIKVIRRYGTPTLFHWSELEGV